MIIIDHPERQCDYCLKNMGKLEGIPILDQLPNLIYYRCSTPYCVRRNHLQCFDHEKNKIVWWV